MKDAFHLEAQLMARAIRQLTILPVGDGLRPSGDLDTRAAKYLPLVGAAMGVVAAIILALTWGRLGAPAATVLALGLLHVLSSDIDKQRLLSPSGLVLTALKAALLVDLPLTAAAILLVAGQATGRMAAMHVNFLKRADRNPTARHWPPLTGEGYLLGTMTIVGLMGVLAIVSGVMPAFTGLMACIVLVNARRRQRVRRGQAISRGALTEAHMLGDLSMILGAAIWL